MSNLATMDKVINVAKGEVGYQEKASKASLDDKTANAGHKNWTKYARDFDEKYPKWYNGKKNGYAWCDMFVDWCFLTAYGYKKAQELLCQFDRCGGAGCTYSYNYYKKNKQSGRTPKVGAQIFFGNESHMDHTGIVYKVDNNYVYTIEGNASDKVCYRKYPIKKENLYYGYPKYDVASSTPKTDDTIILTEAETKDLQRMLIKLGYSCGSTGVDGKFGNYTKTALTKFQKDNGLTANGVYTATTKTKLIQLYNDKVNADNGVPEKPTPDCSYLRSVAKEYVTTGNLNLREGPGKEHKIIAVMPKGAKVIANGCFKGDWYYVKYGKFFGFCSKKYLK